MFEGKDRQLWEHTSALMASWAPGKTADQINPYKQVDSKSQVTRLNPQESIRHISSLLGIKPIVVGEPPTLPPLPNRESREVGKKEG